MTTVIDDMLSDLPSWQVRFNGDFLDFQGRGNPGQEMTLLREFNLAGDGERWLLAAVYSCGPGLVVDFCKMLESEDAQDSEIRAEITVNGRQLAPSHGFGEAWNPSRLAEITDSPCNAVEAEVEYDLITDEECQDDEFAYLKPALAVLSHYDLDPEIGWQFWRQAYHWAGSGKPKIRKVCLDISLEPMQIAGPDLGHLAEGAEISFRHPVTDVEHILRIEKIQDQVIPEQAVAMPGLDLPRYYKQVVYSISPDLPDDACSIVDCSYGDNPRIIANTLNESNDDNVFLPEAAASIGIIGGADGPTSIFVANGSADEGEIRTHSACSSLRFQLVEIVYWKMMFRYRDPAARAEIEI